MNGISIVVPCHNEEHSIVKTIKDLISVLSRMDLKFEIIVVNDASTDMSAEFLKNFQDPIRVITNEIQLGYGGTLKRGIPQSKYDMVLIIDADGTYPCESIPELFKVTVEGNYDMVVGARTKENAQIPKIRRLGKWVISRLANYLCERRIPDLNSGFRIMKKEIIEKYLHILPNGFSFTTTITLAMITNNYSVSYVPINYHKREGKSKIRPIKDTLNFILLIIRTIMYFYPLKIFLPMSLLMFLVGLSLLVVRIFVARILISTTIISLVAGFTILSLGLLADLIDKRMKW